jgi:Raf kinase inhibitor-like YbhB/YbcL family protein
MRKAVWFVVAVAILAGGFGLSERGEAKKKRGGKRMQLQVTSTAFHEGGMIPARYTADGADVSPPLKFEGAPVTAKTIAVICDDPDAPRGTWVHWVLYNLPATVTELPEHVPAQPAASNGMRQGVNDFGTVGYRGPAPPSGTHRYYLRVYALNTTLDLSPRATKAQLEKAMVGRIVAHGELMGKYSRE